MDLDRSALDRIQELEAENADLITLVDLYTAEIEELRAERRIMKAQIMALQKDQKVDYQVA